MPNLLLQNPKLKKRLPQKPADKLINQSAKAKQAAQGPISEPSLLTHTLPYLKNEAAANPGRVIRYGDVPITIISTGTEGKSI